MEYIYIGEIVGTHGLKGEVKIRSNFKYKSLVFKPGFQLYINNRKEEVTITKYRKHKDYDMTTFLDHDDITDVLGFNGEKVYVKKEDLILEPGNYVHEDLIGLRCFINDIYIGSVKDIFNNKATDIFVIDREEKNDLLVPYVDVFIKSIDVVNDEMIIHDVKGLLE